MALERYISYEEYQMLGGTVSEGAFAILERKAQRWLDYFTFDRIKHLTVIPDVVKEVLTDFIEKLNEYNNQSADGDMISQYSNGVETIKYRRTTEEQVKGRLYSIAKQWLPDYLLYRGITFNVEEYLQSENNNP